MKKSNEKHVICGKLLLRVVFRDFGVAIRRFWRQGRDSSVFNRGVFASHCTISGETIINSSAKNPMSSAQEKKFEDSRRRKQRLAEFREANGDHRGFVKRLAYELGVLPTRLQKALTLDGIETRIGDSTYLLSEPLARRIESALELPPHYLDGSSEPGLPGTDGLLRILRTEVVNAIANQYVHSGLGIKLNSDYQVALGEGLPEVSTDLAILSADNDPLLFCNMRVRASNSPAVRNSELKDLLFAAWIADVEYVVLAMAAGTRLDYPNPRYFTYRLERCSVVSSDDVLPTIGELLP